MKTVKWILNINNNLDVRLAWCQLWLHHTSISQKTFCFLLDLIGSVIQWSIRVRPGGWANASSLCSAVHIVFFMLLFRVRCYQHTEHIRTVLLHRTPISWV